MLLSGFSTFRCGEDETNSKPDEADVFRGKTICERRVPEAAVIAHKDHPSIVQWLRDRMARNLAVESCLDPGLLRCGFVG